MASRLRVMTVVGTRPEIIRLSRVISALREVSDHYLVHTGQNYDFELNDIFFRELGVPEPDFFLKADPSSIGSFMGGVLVGTEQLIRRVQPDALVVLGDTNSAICALMARRLKVPVYHLEAGNRSFDPNVPEEINRRMVDHIADYHLVYSEHSRRNLLAEGVRPETIVLIGSPMREILTNYASEIEESDVLDRLGFEAGGFILASAHREENVDDPTRLGTLVSALEAVAEDQRCPVLVSTHPRTRRRLKENAIETSASLHFHKPLGYFDYVKLQRSARCVISDSGTISEEAAVLDFPAVTIRDAIERPEAIDAGVIMTSGLNPSDVVDTVRQRLWQANQYGAATPPAEYEVEDTSRRVIGVIRSTAATHHARMAIRRPMMAVHNGRPTISE